MSAQPPAYQNRESIAEDYKKTLEGLIPICDRYIEITNEIMRSLVQVQAVFVSFKSQSKAMIADVEAQLKIIDSQSTVIPTTEPQQQQPAESSQATR